MSLVDDWIDDSDLEANISLEVMERKPVRAELRGIRENAFNPGFDSDSPTPRLLRVIDIRVDDFNGTSADMVGLTMEDDIRVSDNLVFYQNGKRQALGVKKVIARAQGNELWLKYGR